MSAQASEQPSCRTRGGWGQVLAEPGNRAGLPSALLRPPTSAALWPPGPEARGNTEDTEQSPPDSRGQEWILAALAGARLLAPSLHVVPQALAAYLWGQSWKMARGAGQVTGSTLLPHPGPCLRPSLPMSRPAGSSCPHRHRCDPGPGEGLAGPCRPCA